MPEWMCTPHELAALPAPDEHAVSHEAHAPWITGTGGWWGNATGDPRQPELCGCSDVELEACLGSGTWAIAFFPLPPSFLLCDRWVP